MIKVQILQLVIYFIVVIHWTACFFYAVIWVNRSLLQTEVEDPNADPNTYYYDEDHQRYPVFKYNYWIPQVHLNDVETDFYELNPFEQYCEIYYYVMLLLIGNDVCPQTNYHIFICVGILFVGEIVIGMLNGNIAAYINL